MPIQVKATAGATGYGNPFVGPVDQVIHKKLDLSTLTTREVDADGYLKPGIVLKEAAGVMVPVGAAAGIILAVIEPTLLPLVTIPPTDATLATETADCLVGLAVFGTINRDIAEDNIGAAYTANELASFATAGSYLAITGT